MTPSVQMRIDVNSMPHSFLSVTNLDGSTTEYGLVPAVEGSPFNKGKLILPALILLMGRMKKVS